MGTLSATDYPLKVVDDSGSTVIIKKKPVHILSFTILSDEVLFDLLPPDRFAAVTGISLDPQVSNVAKKAAKVPKHLEFSVEGVLSVNPDLVVVADWSDRAKVNQIRSLGVPVYLISTPVTLERIKVQIQKLALLVGEETGGKGLLQTMEEKLADLKKRLPPHNGGSKSVMDYNTWGASSGKGTSWDEMVRLAGLKNAVGDLKADNYGQVPLSKEILLQQNPQVMLLPSWTYNQDMPADAFLDQVKKDPALRGVSAVKSGQVYLFPERLKSTVSHYFVDGVRELARMAYPLSLVAEETSSLP